MISVYYNQKYGFLIVPNAIERFMGCYISIEPTIEIMAEETIDKIGCAIRKGIKIAESSPKVDESQLNNFWKQTKYKSFPTFSKNYQRIDLKQNGDELEIRRWERNNRGGYSRKTEEKDYINFIEMSDYELGLFIKKMFEPCEIRIDETERFETLEGKIISYSIPNEHYKNIGDGHTDSYMTYRNEDYDKLYISFCIMVILPVLLSGLALGGLYCVQKESIERTYNVDDGAIFVGVYSPIILFGKITDSIYKDMKMEVDTSPEPVSYTHLTLPTICSV